MSITELYAVHITETVQEKYENAVPKFTQRPSIREKKFDDHKFYNFVLFDMETNSTGNLVELCQLAAVDTLTNNFHVTFLPTETSVLIYRSKVNKLMVKTLNGKCTLFKEGQLYLYRMH